VAACCRCTVYMPHIHVSEHCDSSSHCLSCSASMQNTSTTSVHHPKGKARTWRPVQWPVRSAPTGHMYFINQPSTSTRNNKTGSHSRSDNQTRGQAQATTTMYLSPPCMFSKRGYSGTCLMCTCPGQQQRPEADRSNHAKKTMIPCIPANIEVAEAVPPPMIPEPTPIWASERQQGKAGARARVHMLTQQTQCRPTDTSQPYLV
jgi:hypothetical protein